MLLEDDAAQEGLDPEARAELRAIRTSLDRIEDGTYGSCARCGAAMGEDRLRALPFALTCVRCSAG
ncbi:MAG: TraR/DksA C4-type zinc finger protein [Pseudomonadota bacterium]|nr:TraR/DksA C4-type zinc finger protein [Pseudomonadota bacterium]